MEGIIGGVKGEWRGGDCGGGGRREPARGHTKVKKRQTKRRQVTAWVALETVKVEALAAGDETTATTMAEEEGEGEEDAAATEATMVEEEVAVIVMAMGEEEAAREDEVFFFFLDM